MTRFPLDADDATPIEAYRWLPAATPRGAVQIAHGMGEHASRYDALASALNAAGYAVYANEHRGHGAEAEARGELGDFGPRGFAALVADMATLTARIRVEHPGTKAVLLGHSMGSFAAQVYALDHAALIDGLALSGTTAVDLLLASRDSGWKLEDSNAGIPDPRTPFDWLSRDPEQVDRYLADRLCGFTITPASMASMLRESARSADPEQVRRIPATLPIYAFVGDQDPINRGLVLFEAVLDRYRRAGLRDVSSHVYGGARHEVFNETNRDEVTAHLVAWLDRIVR